jgi:diguanylate cyclase (GGDEF)-like protein
VGRFHELNKVLGYRSGDRLLHELGQRLAQAIKPDETLARVGDAQFALLLPRAGAEYATRVAQRLMGILHEPVAVADLMVDAGVAIGIALFPGHGADPDALLRRATAASHQARPTRGGYAFYTGGQEQENTRRLALMGELRHAIEHNELLLYCQPKVNIAARRVCGAEALVRWQHPVRGMISPVEFIKLAEQAGLITPLTNWMLDASFSQSHAWHEAGLDRALSINLSAQDLRDSRLLDRIQGLFSTWGISHDLIQFELTESALMEDPAGGLEALTRLKQLDTALSIDDFGTGYSSLSYLQKLPVDALKIDQSFVMPMMANHDSEVIVRSTIELGHNLELEVVAEGVESQPLWDRLVELGCDVAQGYLMSMPMPADQFKNWNDQWSHTPV